MKIKKLLPEFMALLLFHSDVCKAAQTFD